MKQCPSNEEVFLQRLLAVCQILYITLINMILFPSFGGDSPESHGKRHILCLLITLEEWRKFYLRHSHTPTWAYRLWMHELTHVCTSLGV